MAKVIKIPIVIIILLSLLCSIKGIEAAQGSQEVPVSVNYTKEDEFTLKITVGPGGSVYDGNQKIQNGTVTYGVHLDSQKEMKIQSDSDYRLESVVYIRPEFDDRKNMTNEVVDGQLILVAESTLVEVIIQFEKIEHIPDHPIVPDQPSQGGGTITITPNEDEVKNTLGVDTGDRSESYLPLVLGMLIPMVIFLFLGKKKEDENEEHMTR